MARSRPRRANGPLVQTRPAESSSICAHQGAHRGRQGQERCDDRVRASTIHVRIAPLGPLVGDRPVRWRRLARAPSPSSASTDRRSRKRKSASRSPAPPTPAFERSKIRSQHLLFLPDTEIELTLVGSEPLSECQVKIQAGKALPLSRSNDRTFTTIWKLTEATTLEILLTSAKTALASKPTFLSIGLLKDRAPRVTLRALGTSGHVTPIRDNSTVDQRDRRFRPGSPSVAD